MFITARKLYNAPAPTALETIDILSAVADLREQRTEPTHALLQVGATARKGDANVVLPARAILRPSPDTNATFPRRRDDILRAIGLIGGSGVPVNYPVRAARLKAAGPMTAAVGQAQPNNAGSTVLVTGLASLTSPRS